MSRRYFTIVYAIIFILPSCGAQKPATSSKYSKDDLIKVSIDNFSKGGKLYKRDSVFIIWVDTLSKFRDLQIVSIGTPPSKILLTAKTKAGSTGLAPSRYYEKNGKLFYWRDDNYPLTNETLKIFEKYGLLQDDENGLLKVPTAYFNDSDKAAHYYFCRENPQAFKKVITNIGYGYYEPPNIKCNGKSQ